MLDRLEETARQRFVREQAGLVEQSFGFLAQQVDPFCRHDYGTVAGSDGRFPDGPEALPWRDGQRRHAEMLVDHVSGTWSGEVFLSAHLAAGWCHELDDCLLLIAVNPGRLPGIREIRALHELHARTLARQGRVWLYLLLPNSALQIDAAYYAGGWRSVLSPQINADVFRFAATPAFTLSGSPRGSADNPDWTRAAMDLCRTLHRRAMDEYDAAVKNPEERLRLLRAFWKLMQLESLLRSAGDGEVMFAHTPEAVARVLANRVQVSPEALQELAAVYRGELPGRSGSAESIASLAVRCVRELPPISSGFRRIVETT